jgi:hypothetical protein
MDNDAIPVSYCSPAPYAVPAYQAPYYVIPQRAHAIPQYSAAPQYVYSPSSSSEYGQCNGAPVFKVVPSQSHQHRYPVHNVAPMDTSKKEVMRVILCMWFQKGQCWRSRCITTGTLCTGRRT